MTKKKKSKKDKKTEKKKKGLIAVVRVRGKIHLTNPIKRTLEMLNLHNKNWCSVVPDNDSMRGMIVKVKDYVTWGELSEESFDKIIKEKGEVFKPKLQGEKNKIKQSNFFLFNKKKYKKFFRLSPPKKGYGRKGIKTPFSKGGALGYRGKEIEDLISRMM